MAMNSGVKEYIVGKAVVSNGFPVDFNGVAHVCCHECDYLSRSSGRCVLTKEVIYKPESYTGNRCPLEVKENG